MTQYPVERASMRLQRAARNIAFRNHNPQTRCPEPAHGPSNPLFPLWAAESEADFQTNVIAHAVARGWMYYHTYDARHSVSGFPDLVLTRKGALIFAELKRVREEPSAAQVAWLAALGEAEAATGAVSVRLYVWRPCDMDAVIGALE